MRFMRFKSSTTEPESLGAEPPYARFFPVETVHRGTRYLLAMRTICWICSTPSGATAADGTGSSGSCQNGEYESRYSSTSSSEEKTHSLPTTPSNWRTTIWKSLALTPGGSGMNAPESASIHREGVEAICAQGYNRKAFRI